MGNVGAETRLILKLILQKREGDQCLFIYLSLVNHVVGISGCHRMMGMLMINELKWMWN